MIQFDLPKEKSSIIKVIGIGGGGSNAVNHMYNDGIENVNFIICNTDAQALTNSPVPNKIQLGPTLTQGLGAGANPSIGKQATEESLDEIRKILEVNTKMAFITAGMGGGTGTGGGPIVAKICKELGILTVGIITTPFSYEGKKRMQQAEEGIEVMKQYVDTLLIISNDKLRHQFGNLPFKAAFAKADNILATATKCITDVINQQGHINVDFADVCTAMRNGGVAILGSATAAGEDRAQKAIEMALASPLLNDNDIHGADWILLNITSCEGEYEHTIDEMDTIQAYIQSKAGEECDVILGVGYDSSLGNQLGVTIIATGFKQSPIKKQTDINSKQESKIVMTLGVNNEEKKMANQPSLPFEEENPMTPKMMDTEEERNPVNIAIQMPANFSQNTKEENKSTITLTDKPAQSSAESQPISGGYLTKPANIYSGQDQAKEDTKNDKEENKEEALKLKMIFKEEDEAGENVTPVIGTPQNPAIPIGLEETEDQRKKAAERLAKLRNMSFNVKNLETSPELETVPAYIRRNVSVEEVKNASEGLFSGYTVSDPKNNNQAEISTINTFLEGKKPD
jgi:cell division protein FtsZ